MLPTQDTYPVFEANQVLTSVHLNIGFNFLEEQERLTRANLIGIGIICGLTIQQKQTETGPVIHLTKGCGITSEGYLIMEPADVELVAYREGYEPPKEVLIDHASLEGLPLWELFPAGEPGTTPLAENADFLNGKVVLLFLELTKKGLRNCSPNNCDDRGAEVTATVRRLLIRERDANQLHQLSSLTVFQDAVKQLPEIPLPRVNFSTPTALQNYEQTYRNYFASVAGSAGGSVVDRLKEALEALYSNSILNLLMPNLADTGIQQLMSRFVLPAAPFIFIQYYFDWLRDLTAAYHELRKLLQHQLAICLPNNAAFPRHLMLGLPSEAETDRLRTRFYPAPSVSSNTVGVARFLFDRLTQLIMSFNVPTDASTPIRVTPSLWGTPFLSGRALPFYYQPSLRSDWDVDRMRTVLSWHQTGSDPDYVQNPLDYALEPYNFFRFEGHVGKNVVAVTSTLAKLIREKRLGISILHVNANALGNFLDRHYSIEHEAGTVRGGTLVVVNRGSDGNLVVADFMLPYRIEDKESGCLGRASVRECEFEWFDSQRHMGNLARREYRFGSRPAINQKRVAQEQERKTLGDFYVIRVYSYAIQEQALIDQPTDVFVPIGELVDEGISAIARALNTAFPGGVVFDHKPDSNKLIIRHFQYQRFRIEWAGVQGNQIRYAYKSGESCSIERLQKGKWESMDKVANYKVTYQLMNDYQTAEYQWLQQSDVYGALYPTTDSMATAEELIKWEKMITKRAADDFGDLLIADLLRAVIKLVEDNDNKLSDIEKIVLIGSWANGSWVARENGQKYPKDFTKLRRKVTGKDEPSDIDLLIQRADGATLTADTVINTIMDKLTGKDKSQNYSINVVFGRQDAQKGLFVWRRKAQKKG